MKTKAAASDHQTDRLAPHLEARVVDHRAEAGRRRVDAHADVGQHRLGEHQPEKSITIAMMHDVHDVGQDVPRDDARIAHAEGVRGLDVLELAQLERLAAQQPAEPGPARQAEDHAQHEQPEVGALRGGRNQLGVRSIRTCIISTAAAISSTPGIELSVV